MRVQVFLWRAFLTSTLVTSATVGGFVDAAECDTQPNSSKVQLTPTHLEAVSRRRRVIVHFDVIHGEPKFTNLKPDELVKLWFTFADQPGSQIDSIWWSWGEGNQSPYPSKILPLYNHPGYKKWADNGIDIMRIFLEASHKRGLEAFRSYVVNGSDRDLGPLEEIPLKREHPEWLIPPNDLDGPHTVGGRFWNFEIPQVREHKLEVLREVVENYDFDGLEMEFSEAPLFPIGRQWKCREYLTQFMRTLRAMTLAQEARRGRPYLLAAHVPENLVGCRVDGIDVETWAREQLVDIFVMGRRSYDVDVEMFRRITAGTHIQLHPGSDEHHTTSGYNFPPIEVLRGVFSNWWHQGVDGLYTYNWNYALHKQAVEAGVMGAPHYSGPPGPLHRQLYQEMGEPEMLRYQDKTFVVQRRGNEVGGSYGSGGGPPRRWLFYNIIAQLPARLANDGIADTLLFLDVGDDLTVEAVCPRIKSLTLRVLLNDPASKDLPEDQKIEKTLIQQFRQVDYYYNDPPLKVIKEQLEMRFNNVPLGKPVIEHGWLVYPVQPQVVALGENLVGLRVIGVRAASGDEIVLEKLELHVKYHSL